MRKPHHLLSLRHVFVALLLALAGSVLAQQQDTAANVTFPDAGVHRDAVLTARIIDAPHGTFGYEVYSDGRLLVQQPNVPGRAGLAGCPKREQAEKLSALVIDKIQRGIMPPTVNDDELKALGL